MMPPSRHFLLANDFTANDLLELLQETLSMKEARPETGTRVFLDSFDWLLYDSGFVLVRDETAGEAILRQIALDSGQVVARCPSNSLPVWPAEIDSQRMRAAVEKALKVRVILPLCESRMHLRTFSVLNSERKTTVRIKLERHQVSATGNTGKQEGNCDLVRVIPVRGYDREYESVVEILHGELGESINNRAFLDSLFDRVGRQPLDTSSKFRIQLDPLDRSDDAVKRVCLQLLATIRLNEEGVVEGIDSEYLHDFRVAIRRTRSVLSQFKKILPPEVVVYFKEEFRWIGGSTGPLRDMDVYLIRFEDYQSWLAPEVRSSLEPLKRFLKNRQKREHRSVARKVRSKRYRAALDDWQEYLTSPSENIPRQKHAATPIGTIARRLTWRAYRKALRQGDAIISDPNSPAEAMHELRITCKKLRYLMELFRSLYPPEEIKERISILKRLQDCLGDHQDFAVQQEHLKLFALEMNDKNDTPVEVYLAMGRLGAHLELLAETARDSFAALYEQFSNAKAKKLFADLFKDESAGDK